MAVAFPSIGWSALDIPFNLGISSARTEGGFIVTSRKGDPFVAGTMSTGNLEPYVHSDFVAFLLDCVDRNLRVDFVHPRHLVPRAYTLDTLPFAGTATVESLPDLRTIELSGLPIGLILKRGDRVTLEQGDLRCCRWVRSDLIVSSVLSENIPLTPRLPLGVFAAASIARFKNPPLRLMVKDGSFFTEEAYQPTPVSFDVSEVLS